ncbi:MAG: hypothetical protein AAFV96_18215, partial [Pseudomonadota bacterium]
EDGRLVAVLPDHRFPARMLQVIYPPPPPLLKPRERPSAVRTRSCHPPVRPEDPAHAGGAIACSAWSDSAHTQLNPLHP